MTRKKKYSTASIAEPVLGDLQKLAVDTERSVSFYATKFSREMMILTGPSFDPDMFEVKLKECTEVPDGEKKYRLSFTMTGLPASIMITETTLRQLTQQAIQLTLKAENDAKGK